MKAIAVEFKDLWKIRSPVGMCEGFKLQTFDKLIEVGLKVGHFDTSDIDVKCLPPPFTLD